jgi:CheY-like chemotaxis protein
LLTKDVILPNILVIDDNPEMRRLLSRILEREGHNVVLSEDGIDSVAKHRAELPDLVITDMMMPKQGEPRRSTKYDHVMGFSFGQHDTDGKTYGIAAEMDLGREPAARTAKLLELNHPFSPAAQRCARIVVLSIICNASNAPPPSANPCNRTSHTPHSHQRRNCRQTEFQLPNASGRSRHGAPVRQIHNIPSSTRRWLAGGAPATRGRDGQERRNDHPFFVRHQTADHSQPPGRKVGLESHAAASGEAPWSKTTRHES